MRRHRIWERISTNVSTSALPIFTRLIILLPWVSVFRQRRHRRMNITKLTICICRYMNYNLFPFPSVGTLPLMSLGDLFVHSRIDQPLSLSIVHFSTLNTDLYNNSMSCSKYLSGTDERVVRHFLYEQRSRFLRKHGRKWSIWALLERSFMCACRAQLTKTLLKMYSFKTKTGRSSN
jgi:hypothetical protein